MDEQLKQLFVKWREDRRRKAAELLALDEAFLRKLNLAEPALEPPVVAPVAPEG